MVPLRYLLVLLMGMGLVVASCANEYDDDYSPDDDAAVDDDSAADDDDDSGGGDQPELFYTPPQLAFGSVCVGSSGMLTLSIANLGTAPLEIVGLNCPLPAVSFEPWTGSLPPDSPPLDVEITVTCSESGTFTSPFKIISNDPVQPMANIPLEVSCDC